MALGCVLSSGGVDAKTAAAAAAAAASVWLLTLVLLLATSAGSLAAAHLPDGCALLVSPPLSSRAVTFPQN